MHIQAKPAIAALMAAAALAALVSSASARNLSISNQNIRVAWSSVEFGGSGITVRCGVTLEGSFHTRTIAKVAGSLVGYVTRAIVRRPCTGGTVWAENGTEANEVLGGTLTNTLPWHLTYEGFGGTLPNITSVRILLTGSKFQIRAVVFGVAVLCAYRSGGGNGNVTGTATRNTTTGVIDNLVASGTIRSESGGACPEGGFRTPAEDGIVSVLATTSKITVTLI
jgi:hypothetical protein